MLLQTWALKRRGLSLAELLVAGGLLTSIATITTLMFSNLRATITRSSSQMEATQRARLALERVPPLLSAAYIPALSGASLALETPIAPIPPGARSMFGTGGYRSWKSLWDKALRVYRFVRVAASLGMFLGVR